MVIYRVNRRAVTLARWLIDAGRYVVDSDWGEVQPKAAAELKAEAVDALNSMVFEQN